MILVLSFVLSGGEWFGGGVGVVVVKLVDLCDEVRC